MLSTAPNHLFIGGEFPRCDNNKRVCSIGVQVIFAERIPAG
jgi:hypothetical protein